MSAITLYGAAYSTCTQRVLITLHELGLDYKLSPIEMKLGAHKEKQYIANLHPFGRIPALQDGDLILFESRAICRYLVAKYAKDDSTLRVPTQPTEVARFEQLASVEYSYFDPPVTQLAYEKLFKSMMGHGETDNEVASKLTDQLEEALSYYEAHLSVGRYITGKDLSLLDIFHLTWLAMLPSLVPEGSLTSRPGLNAWYSLMASRESWKRVQALLPH